LVETKWRAQQLFLSDAHVMYPSLHFKKLNGRDNQKKKKAKGRSFPMDEGQNFARQRWLLLD
jgi:hypothetical protein